MIPSLLVGLQVETVDVMGEGSWTLWKVEAKEEPDFRSECRWGWKPSTDGVGWGKRWITGVERQRVRELGSEVEMPRLPQWCPVHTD